MLHYHSKAKINLFLHITGRRPDNYHDLQSLVVFADYGDHIVLSSGSKYKLTCTGPYGALVEKNNIIDKVCSLLSEVSKRELNFEVELKKNLPVEAGIGGGSGDAAAMVKLLFEHWQLQLPKQVLDNILNQLGADVPVCFQEKSTFMEGVGERLYHVELPQLYLLLVNPGVGVSTKGLFAQLMPPYSEKQDFSAIKFLSTNELISFLKEQRNDFEPLTIKEQPIIAEILTSLSQSGALISRMSGSGATCFGLFSSLMEAEEAAIKIRKQQANWWVVSSVTI